MNQEELISKLRQLNQISSKLEVPEAERVELIENATEFINGFI